MLHNSKFRVKFEIWNFSVKLQVKFQVKIQVCFGHSTLHGTTCIDWFKAQPRIHIMSAAFGIILKLFLLKEKHTRHILRMGGDSHKMGHILVGGELKNAVVTIALFKISDKP
jgi:hypothetical protein